MPYNSLISRVNAASLIPEEVSREIVQGVATTSLVMQLARRLPNMNRNQLRMPVLSALAVAYFVDSDIGLKKTTSLEWENKYVYAEEMACIVPIPEAVLDDADYDIWGEARPRIIEAMGYLFDRAVFNGTSAPAAWPDDITLAATNAGNTVVDGAGADIYDDVMGDTGTLSLVEADGFVPNGHAATIGIRGRLRGLRDANGVPIFVRSIQEGGGYELDGSPITFARNAGMDATASLMISGDWSQLVYSLRQDITFKILDQAVISDGAGAIVYNLPQQDMVALRAVMRLGWQVPNPINKLNEVEATRYPFAVLTP